MDWAVDPNGDGITTDHLDIVNMSLGSDYGESFDDDLSLAVDSASSLGMLTVAAAGNGGDKPYIAGTPASARTALSVAQTEVPSARRVPARGQQPGGDRRDVPEHGDASTGRRSATGSPATSPTSAGAARPGPSTDTGTRTIRTWPTRTARSR